MFSARLMRMIEEHAEQLTRSVLRDLGNNPRIPAYHQLSPDKLQGRVYDVFHNFARWLGYQTDEPMESWYGELGKERSAEGIPLSEVVYALILTKYHLQDYVRSTGLADSALELYQELELHRLSGHFFDKAIYYAARGYEREASARRESGMAAATR